MLNSETVRKSSTDAITPARTTFHTNSYQPRSLTLQQSPSVSTRFSRKHGISYAISKSSRSHQSGDSKENSKMLFVNPNFSNWKYVSGEKGITAYARRMSARYIILEAVGLDTNSKTYERYHSQVDIDFKNEIQSNLIVEEHQANQVSWNIHFEGTRSLTRYTDNRLGFNKLAVFLNVSKEDFGYVFEYLRNNVFLFFSFLFLAPIEHHKEVIYKFQESKSFCSQNIGLHRSCSFIPIISYREPHSGKLAKNKYEIEFKKDDEVLITSDREYASKVTKRIIYINFSFYINDFKECDIVKLDNIHLSVIKIELAKKLLYCKVIAGGNLKSFTRAIFSKSINFDISKVTLEELEDLTFSMQMNVRAILVPPVSSCFQEYHNSILSAMKLLAYENCRILGVVLLDTLEELLFEHPNHIDWLAKTYDGVYLWLYSHQPRKKEIINLSNAAKQLIKNFYDMKKPILLGGHFAQSCQIDQSLLVDPESHKYIFYYPDKYCVRTIERNFNYMKAYTDMIDDHTYSIRNYALQDLEDKTFIDKSSTGSDTFARTIVKLSYEIRAAVIILLAKSGRMASKISHFRPNCPIIVLTNNPNIVKYLNVYHNVWVAYYTYLGKNTNRTLLNLKKILYGILYGITFNIISQGDEIIYVYRSKRSEGYPDKVSTFTADNEMLRAIYKSVSDI